MSAADWRKVLDEEGRAKMCFPHTKKKNCTWSLGIPIQHIFRTRKWDVLEERFMEEGEEELLGFEGEEEVPWEAVTMLNIEINRVEPR